MTADIAARVRLERARTMRWLLLVTLNVSRPVGMYADAMRPIIAATYPDVTEQEVRRELDYLAARELVELRQEPHGAWYAKLDRHGIDIVEYSIDCEPGISRPQLV